MPPWYPLLLALVGLQRLRELLLSRRLERDLAAGRRAAARSYPLMVTLHVALFAAPLCELAAFRRRARAPLLWVGVLGGATALRWWSMRSLGAAWNVRAVVPSDLRPVTGGRHRTGAAHVLVCQRHARCAQWSQYSYVASPGRFRSNLLSI